MIVATSTVEIGNAIYDLLDEIPDSDIGDINEDGLINIMDIIIVINIILNGNYIESADLNNDNIINILDIIILVNTILRY